jgi:hypothetical protein
MTGLNSTMIYSRVQDMTVAEDYYTAMEIIDKRPEPHLHRLSRRTIGMSAKAKV